MDDKFVVFLKSYVYFTLGPANTTVYRNIFKAASVNKAVEYTISLYITDKDFEAYRHELTLYADRLYRIRD